MPSEIIKPTAFKKPDLNVSFIQPILIGEFRGVQLETISWHAKEREDKTMREAGAMEKAAYNVELMNGMPCIAVQMGRDFEAVYEFERGKRYAFAVARWFEAFRDKPAMIQFRAAYEIGLLSTAISGGESSAPSVPKK